MYFLSGMEKGTPPVLFEISLRLSAVKFPTIPILKTKTSGIDVVLSVFCVICVLQSINSRFTIPNEVIDVRKLLKTMAFFVIDIIYWRHNLCF